MKPFLATIAFLSLAACGPRGVQVTTGPQPVTESTIRVTNNLAQPINVYVVNAGSDLFLRQVAAHSAESMSVPGIAAGSTVELKAVPADGSRTYTRNDVTLTSLYEWQIP